MESFDLRTYLLKSCLEDRLDLRQRMVEDHARSQDRLDLRRTEV